MPDDSTTPGATPETFTAAESDVIRAIHIDGQTVSDEFLIEAITALIDERIEKARSKDFPQPSPDSPWANTYKYTAMSDPFNYIRPHIQERAAREARDKAMCRDSATAPAKPLGQVAYEAWSAAYHENVPFVTPTPKWEHQTDHEKHLWDAVAQAVMKGLGYDRFEESRRDTLREIGEIVGWPKGESITKIIRELKTRSASTGPAIDFYAEKHAMEELIESACRIIASADSLPNNEGAGAVWLRDHENWKAGRK